MLEGWKRVEKNHSGECGHGCPCVTRGPRFSVRLGRDRIDTEERFECRRCLRLTTAEDGGDVDEFDPHGDLCSDCWVHIRDAAEAVIPVRNDESKRFACQNSTMLFRSSGLREAFLGDGSTWVEFWPIPGRIKEWRCTQGPR